MKCYFHLVAPAPSALSGMASSQLQYRLGHVGPMRWPCGFPEWPATSSQWILGLSESSRQWPSPVKRCCTNKTCQTSHNNSKAPCPRSSEDTPFRQISPHFTYSDFAISFSLGAVLMWMLSADPSFRDTCRSSWDEAPGTSGWTVRNLRSRGRSVAQIQEEVNPEV
jgi:hypothetical protein